MFKKVVVVGLLLMNLCGAAFAEEFVVSTDEIIAVDSNGVVKELEKEAVRETPKEASKEAPNEVVKQTKEDSREVVITPVAVESQAEFVAKYDFDWQNVKLADALYAVAKRAGKNVALSNKLDEPITITITQKTFDETLNILAKMANFNWMLEGDTILINTSGTMLQSKLFELKNSTMKYVKDDLVSMGIPAQNIGTNSEYNTISVTGTPYQIGMAEKRISEMDKPVAQVLIVAQMVEVTHGDSLTLGMQYSMPTYYHEGASSTSNSSSSSTTSSSSGSGSLFSGSIWDKLSYSITSNANKSLNKGKVIARPMSMAKNGEKTFINIEDQVPVLTTTTTTSSTEITVKYEKVGTSLDATAFINKENGTVSLTVAAKASNIVKWITEGKVSAPQIATREAKTSATVRSGETLVIGGLMNSSEMDNLSGIPGLMKLPILGEIFKFHSKSKDKSEMFILITPYIIEGGMDMAKIKMLLD